MRDDHRATRWMTTTDMGLAHLVRDTWGTYRGVCGVEAAHSGQWTTELGDKPRCGLCQEDRIT